MLYTERNIMPSVKETLENPDWVAANYKFLRESFPEEFVTADMEFFLRLGFRLKLHGVEWKQLTDIPNFLGKYHHSKIFDSCFTADKTKGSIRRYPVVDGVEPIFVYPPADKVRVLTPVGSPPAAPSFSREVIDVIIKNRDESEATKLINLIRNRVK